MSQAKTRPVTRDDIEAKLREIQGGADTGAEAAKGAGLAAGAALVLVALIIAFLWGRHRGKKRRTVVEIRRV
jgi:hypothetical protein